MTGRLRGRICERGASAQPRISQLQSPFLRCPLFSLSPRRGFYFHKSAIFRNISHSAPLSRSLSHTHTDTHALVTFPHASAHMSSVFLIALLVWIASYVSHHFSLSPLSLCFSCLQPSPKPTWSAFSRRAAEGTHRYTGCCCTVKFTISNIKGFEAEREREVRESEVKERPRNVECDVEGDSDKEAERERER